jgi:hypothetical protein
MNGCGNGFLLLALCWISVKRSVGHSDKGGARQNCPAFRTVARVFRINERINIGFADTKRIKAEFPYLPNVVIIAFRPRSEEDADMLLDSVPHIRGTDAERLRLAAQADGPFTTGRQ